MGVYAGGSIALGGYDPRRSDVDVAAVSTGPLPVETKLAIVDALRHESLPCPARGLELVVYSETSVREATPEPAYELNLNTGRAMPFRMSLSSEGDHEHWYAIDRAILREHGRALAGQPPGEHFGALPRGDVLDLVSEAVRWHEEPGRAADDDAVLNACRAWRYAVEGVWSSKPAAGEWASDRAEDGGLVAQALATRAGSGELGRDRVTAFLGRVRKALDDERGAFETSVS